MTRIIAIRPEPGLSETLELAREMGIEAQGLALSRALPCDWDAPSADPFDAILAGSANAFRHSGDQLAQFAHLPVYAVGQKTAEAAQAKGFMLAHIGSGGLQGIVDEFAGNGDPADQSHHWLRLAGKDHVALELPDFIQIDSRIVYKMEALPLLDKAAALLNSGAIILLFSASSAKHFRSECERLALNLSDFTIAGLGPRITNAAGEGWAAVHSAERPDTAALLALARSLCN
jgi:uroporphyrinogen-III synthase